MQTQPSSTYFARFLRTRNLRWLVSLALLLTIGSQANGLVSAADAPATTCKLVIDYGDGVQKQFSSLVWKEGMTVLDLMTAASKHPRGIQFEFRGTGETAFLFRLDNLKNEGKGKNWTYHVGEKRADRSFAVFTLKAGDVVLWKFEEYR